VAFIPAKAMVKEVRLQANAKLIAKIALPVTDDSAHVTPEGEIYQGVKVIRHEHHHTDRPFAKRLVKLDALKNFDGAFGSTKSVHTAWDATDGQKIGRIPLGKRRDGVIKSFTSEKRHRLTL
jgi:hypothetical protein